MSVAGPGLRAARRSLRAAASARRAACPAAPKFTVQEYFAIERQSEIRYEYVEGERLIADARSLASGRITIFTVNIGFAIKAAFQGRDCRVQVEAVRVRVSPSVCSTATPKSWRFAANAIVTDGENP